MSSSACLAVLLCGCMALLRVRLPAVVHTFLHHVYILHIYARFHRFLFVSFLSPPLCSLYVSGLVFIFSKTLASCSKITIWSNSRPFLPLFLRVCVHTCPLSVFPHCQQPIGLAVPAPLCRFALGPAAGVLSEPGPVSRTHTHKHNHTHTLTDPAHPTSISSFY